MKYLEMNSFDVFENLATEEYVLNTLTDDSYLLTYQNDDSLVVGKYQNAFQEINVVEAEKAGIKVARRISGGGTVFHDRGNLNYAFISSSGKNGLPDYDDFLTPVISALQQLGIQAKKRNICDIAIGDKKISGSAQAVHGNRILHHGTLLFHADLYKLQHFLKVSDASIDSKAVQSVPSPVTNISTHLKDASMTIEEFKTALCEQLAGCKNIMYSLTPQDKQAIQQLKAEKYDCWEWNFGKSPDFTLHRNQVELCVKHGKIADCHGTFLSKEMSELLIGQRYGYANLFSLLYPFLQEDTEKYIKYLF